MNSIMFQSLVIGDVTIPDKGVPDHLYDIYTTQQGDVLVYHCRARRPRLHALVSEVFATNLLSEFRNQILWYGFSDTNFIARLPLAQENAEVWQPCETPAKFHWVEYRYADWDSYESDLEILHSEDFPPDGFTPVGSVRIVGERVLSDDPKAAFPPDAEWLIWEKDGGAYRLCQMREGHWSVCQDAPRKDAPKMIVINNDLDTVYLLYALAIDPADVEGSLQKITTFLQDHNALQPTEEAK